MRRQHFTPLCRARRRPDARSSWGRGRNTGRSLVRFRASGVRLRERLVRSQADRSTSAIKKMHGRSWLSARIARSCVHIYKGIPRSKTSTPRPPPPVTPAGAEATQSGERPHPRSCMMRRNQRRVIDSTTLRHTPETRTAEVRQHLGRPDHYRSSGERQWLQILYQARFWSNMSCRIGQVRMPAGCRHDLAYSGDSISRDTSAGISLADGRIRH